VRYELTDHEWAAIKPMLPNKPRDVPRVNDRGVLNGYLLGFANWRTVARCATGVRSLYHVLQSLRSLASG
jgi:transposase